MHEPISPDQRLIVTLQCLANGGAYTTRGANYRISLTTFRRFSNETCRTFWHRLSEANYLKAPSAAAEWEGIAWEFENRWKFPCAIGAIDGKYVVRFQPAGSGSASFNYMKTHSIPLLGVCDAKYKLFLLIYEIMAGKVMGVSRTTVT